MFVACEMDSRRQKFLLMLLATVLVCGGCSHVSSIGDAGPDSDSDSDSDSDTDTGPVECNLGEYSGDFEILKYSDVATLAGYTSISGNLTIECNSCTELSELICLASVGGGLVIGGISSSNPDLTNLDDLSSITSVGGLYVSGNNALTNLDGLSSITGSIGGGLHINNNDALTNLNGLNGITSLGGDLIIGSYYYNGNEAAGGNPVIVNLDGLTGITSVSGGLWIECNYALINLDGLSSITGSLDGDMSIWYNDALANIDGLNGITSVSGNLGIRINASLTDLDGLGALTSVGTELEIYWNNTLPDCEVCDLLDQLTSTPTVMDVSDNFDDTCTPVPGNCP